MENVLVVGINTRPVACSAKKMRNTVYSVDYFCTGDLVTCSDNLKCVLSQKPYKSCGNYAENYDPELIYEYANEFIDKVDYILCTSGVTPENFPKSKIVGNKKIGHVDNKYKLYNSLKNKFKVPETFQVQSYEDAAEIVHSFDNKQFIVKPVIGAGGKGICWFEDTTENSNFNNVMLQEFIEGESISASVLSTSKEAKTILTSKQIIGETKLGQIDKFGYCGNIAPYKNDPRINQLAEDVIMELSLLGSNGVDMIDTGDDLYVIEVNPRFQGTFECAEEVLGINMVDAHCKATKGTLIEVPSSSKYAVKMIVFAKKRSIAGNLDFDGVYDIPRKNVIIEKDEPAVTIIRTGETPESAIYEAQKTVKKAYKSFLPFP